MENIQLRLPPQRDVPAPPPQTLSPQQSAALDSIRFEPAQLWAMQLIKKVESHPSKDGTPLLLHALLVVAGLPDDPKERAKFLAPWRGLSGAAIKAFMRAADTSDLILNDQDKSLYLLHRIRGASHDEAEVNSRYGPFDLVLDTPDKRAAVFATLKAHGISNAPLCFPRVIAKVAHMEKLGEGGNNTVFKVRINGREYAWKPANPFALPSPVSSRCGIKNDAYFPVESNLIAYKIAKALAGPDGHCVVGEAVVGIVNGQAGLLMAIAPGKNRYLGGHGYRKEVPHDAKGYEICRKNRHLMSQPLVYKNLCKQLGLTGLSWEGDTLYVTSVSPEYPVKKELFDNPSFLESMADGALVADVGAWCDSHTYNMHVSGYQGKDSDPIKVTFIDCDDFGAPLDYAQVARETDDEARHGLYFMSPPARWLAESSATRFTSARFNQEIRVMNHDLKFGRNYYYPKERLDAINRRISARQNEVLCGLVKTIDNPDEWTQQDFSDPMASFVGRSKARDMNQRSQS